MKELRQLFFEIPLSGCFFLEQNKKQKLKSFNVKLYIKRLIHNSKKCHRA